MKINYLLLLFAFIIILSCDKSYNQKKITTEILNETPEMLIDSSAIFESHSFFSRYDSDIIKKLFNEAIDKNKKLGDLVENIEVLLEDRFPNETKNTNKFLNVNNQYWKSVEIYISQINDSMMKNATEEYFNNQEKNYRKSILKHKFEINLLNNKVKILNDKITLVKLAVTGKMMNNFQKNELPSIDKLKILNLQLDTIIKRTEEFSKLKN